MLEEGRINSRQLFFIMFWAIMATAILLLPVMIGRYAPRDAWMGAVVFIIGNVIIVWVASKLGMMFPEHTIVQYNDFILGPWLGKLTSLVFIGWIMHNGSVVHREVGEFLKFAILPETPLYVIIILISIAPAYAVYNGLEVIGRAADFLFPIVTLFIALIYLLLIPDYEVSKLFPLFGDGGRKILRGSLTLIALGGQMIMVLFFLPFIKETQKVGKVLVWTVIAIGLGGVFSEATYTMVYGLERTALTVPFYNMARYVSIGLFIERMDPLFVVANMMGNFLKLSIFIYVVVLGLAQLFKMKNYRPLIIPVIVVENLLGVYGFKNGPEMYDFTDKVWPFYTLPLEFGLPLLLLIVARLRGLGNKK